MGTKQKAAIMGLQELDTKFGHNAWASLCVGYIEAQNLKDNAAVEVEKANTLIYGELDKDGKRQPSQSLSARFIGLAEKAGNLEVFRAMVKAMRHEMTEVGVVVDGYDHPVRAQSPQSFDDAVSIIGKGFKLKTLKGKKSLEAVKKANKIEKDKIDAANGGSFSYSQTRLKEIWAKLGEGKEKKTDVTGAQMEFLTNFDAFLDEWDKKSNDFVESRKPDDVKAVAVNKATQGKTPSKGKQKKAA